MYNTDREQTSLAALRAMGMSDSELKKIQKERDEYARKSRGTTRVRSANQRLTDAQKAPPLHKLFGCLWETPGIAILAGDTGVGKSILAVHIAHLISSDKNELLGLCCNGRQKVLYYDFELIDRQFAKRFKNLPFTDDFLICDTDPANYDAQEFTFEHINADLDRTGAKIVILDNITALALKTTADADISIGIMKGLKKMQQERGVSSLILAHTPKLPASAALTLNHLAGSKHLSNFADSVFFIGRSAKATHLRYIKQVKNRTDEEMEGVIVCELNDEQDYLGLAFIEIGEEVSHLMKNAEVAQNLPRKAPLPAVLVALSSCLIHPKSAGQLEAQLAEQFYTNDRTIRTRLKEIVETGAQTINKSGHPCTVVKFPKGREAWYSLNKIHSSS